MFSSDLLLLQIIVLGAAAYLPQIGVTIHWSWRIARFACGSALALTIFSVFWSANGELDFLGFAVGLLANFLGLVITDYSARYLRGEPHQLRYVSALMLTLASVNVLVFTTNLLLLVASWTATSFSLHILLTYYTDREAAIMAARKKFMVSRLADCCLLVALFAIYISVGSFDLKEIAKQLGEANGLSFGLSAATVCVTFAVLLRSAQLPLHGWLIQVMEAPTPVSALLHAGVINLGGFMVMRLAPLFAASTIAQTILVVSGTLTAVLAGAIMLTRITIKVRLAWSTCAQMGFMLVECGLGLFDVALLHLIGHSLYKGYSFLRAGEAVIDSKRRALFAVPEGSAATLQFILLALGSGVLGCVLSFFSAAVWEALVPAFGISTIALLLIGMAVAPLTWPDLGPKMILSVRGAVQGVLLIQLYFVWHIVFLALLPHHRVFSPPDFLLFVAAAGFSALYVMQILIVALPAGRFATALYPLMYFGMFFDEFFTHTVWRIWPAKPSRVAAVIPLFSALFGGSQKDDA